MNGGHLCLFYRHPEKVPSLWSVELFLPEQYENSTGSQEVGLGFLFRERLGTQLQKGKKILILREIAPVLAEGEIISVVE